MLRVFQRPNFDYGGENKLVPLVAREGIYRVEYLAGKGVVLPAEVPRGKLGKFSLEMQKFERNPIAACQLINLHEGGRKMLSNLRSKVIVA